MVAAAEEPPEVDRPRRSLFGIILMLIGLVINLAVGMVVVEQLFPDLDLRYQVRKYGRWIGWGGRYGAWWVRNFGKPRRD